MKGLGILDRDKGVFFELVLNALLIELKLNGIVAVEVEFRLEGKI